MFRRLVLVAPVLLAGCVQPGVATAPVATMACDTSIRVSNQSSGVVQQLYFSHSSLNAWGADQLGASVLPPGRFVNYRMNNPGNYDFRVVWSNGQAAELRRVNVCAASQVIVTNAGLRAG
ncbi:hypothetical protein ACI6QG_14145 [Roseococcus sp. DSY-14]|uniref:hypothetical protein n=1 Tax=Roseococcus sp. DSY-14 TaxID=3369650 RepID=UPI00387B8239